MENKEMPSEPNMSGEQKKSDSFKDTVLLYLHDFVTWLVVILLVLGVGMLGEGIRERLG